MHYNNKFIDYKSCIIIEKFKEINYFHLKKIISFLNESNLKTIIFNLKKNDTEVEEIHMLNMNVFEIFFENKKEHYNTNLDLTYSLELSNFLKQYKFNIICFYDCPHLGFWSLREKKLGRGFETTAITNFLQKDKKEENLSSWAENQFLNDVDFTFDINNFNKYEEKINNKIDNNKKISLCIPFYNHSKYLNNLIKSFENQSKKPNEIILVNDGSTEHDVINILNSIKTDLNLKIFHTTNKGPSSAKNFAVSKSCGDYIIFFDADNFPNSNFIESLYNSINYSNYDVIFSSFHIIKNFNKSATYIALGNYIQEAKEKNVIGDTCCIVKKNVAEVCPFIEDKEVHEDWLWGLEINLRGYKASSIYEPLFNYRKNTNCKSDIVNKNLTKHKDYIKKLFKKYSYE